MSIIRFPDASTAAAEFQQSFHNFGPVPGLGDQARALPGVLYILKGSNIVSIALIGATKQSDAQGAARTLGTKLVGQI